MSVNLWCICPPTLMNYFSTCSNVTTFSNKCFGQKATIIILVFGNKLESNNQIKLFFPFCVHLRSVRVWVKFLLETESLPDVFDPEAHCSFSNMTPEPTITKRHWLKMEKLIKLMHSNDDNKRQRPWFLFITFHHPIVWCTVGTLKNQTVVLCFIRILFYLVVWLYV